MANEIIINVKVRNDTSQGAAAVDAALKTIGETASNSGRQASDAIGSIADAAASALPSVTSMLTGIAIGLPSLVAGFLALIPALLAVAGAAGAAATAMVGIGAAFGALKIGFGGIGDALTAHSKAQAGGAKAAKDNGEAQYAAAKRIQAASRAVRDAKEEEVAAAKAVNQARADEIDRLRELDLQLRGANISQAEAAQALVEAKEKQRRADIAGSEWEKAEARNAVARAQLTYDEQTEKLGDLTEEKKKATKNGVEGSDQVQRALEREKKAHERVMDAQQNLADAHRKTATAAAAAGGGINAFAAAMDKLSPNAKKLVYALLDIEKRFDAIKKRVQDRLLAGWDVEVRNLADKWLPALDRILGSMADHLNVLGTAWAKALGNDSFIGNIEEASHGFETFVDHIRDAGTAGFDAFGRISKAAVPVLDVIGEMLENVFTKFDDWIKRADDTGNLQSFFEDAANMLQRIFDTIGLVITDVGKFLEIIYPSGKSASNSAFDSVDATLTRIGEWLDDPKNQKQVLAFIDLIKQVGRGIRDLWPVIKFAGVVAVASFQQFVIAIGWVRMQLGWLKSAAGAAWDWIYQKAAGVVNWFGRIGNWLSNSLSNAWYGLKAGFRDAINYVIAKWNGLKFTMPSLLGGGTVGVPQIPYRASGGIAGGLTMINERGGELVKLPNGSMVVPAGQTAGILNGTGKGGATVILSPARSGDALLDAIWEALAGRIRAKGGLVQTALGVPGAK